MRASFVIPSYNSVEWLPHAIESALNQEWPDVEIVVINDGSTDTTNEYLQWLIKRTWETPETQHKRHITTWPLPLTNREPNELVKHGRSWARNKGNSLTTGDVIFVLDADDYAHPSRVKNTMKRINAGAQFVYGSARIMDIFGKDLGILHADVFDLAKAKEELVNKIVHSSVAYTKEIALKFPYSENPEISDNGIDDWDQQIRIAEAGIKMDFVVSSVVAYRQLESSISHVRDEVKVKDIKRKLLGLVAV